MKAEFYHYHFDGKVHVNDLVAKMNKFAKGLVTVDNNNSRYPGKWRIHCKHSCIHFRNFGAFAKRGDYIVYNKDGHLQHVMSPELFHETFEEVSK